MNCTLTYCIYNKDRICILDAIEIDSLGMCESCEIVAIPVEEVERHKSRRLEQIEKL